MTASHFSGVVMMISLSLKVTLSGLSVSLVNSPPRPFNFNQHGQGTLQVKACQFLIPIFCSLLAESLGGPNVDYLFVQRRKRLGHLELLSRREIGAHQSCNSEFKTHCLPTASGCAEHDIILGCVDRLKRFRLHSIEIIKRK